MRVWPAWDWEESSLRRLHVHGALCLPAVRCVGLCLPSCLDKERNRSGLRRKDPRGQGYWTTSNKDGGSSLHSLNFFSAMMLEPIPDVVPQFMTVVYLNDQLIGHYDDNRSKCLPEPSWAEKVEKTEDAPFWDWCTLVSLKSKNGFREDLSSLQNHDKQSRELHTWQCIHYCELSQHGNRTPHYRVAYDGKDFLSLDMETLTWRAAGNHEALALVIMRKWEAKSYVTQAKAYFTKEKCVWLEKFLKYGKEALLRREPPVVKVVRKAEPDGQETLICRAHGFYPKEINATWRKDDQPWEKKTLHGSVTPNSDGTYHTWLSIEIDPKDRDHYRCHVQHVSLGDPVDVAWEEFGIRRSTCQFSRLAVRA
ncbi:major histocompatibility complex class I-related gene protein-like [Hemicordylus capensis]|uniref:major histocompatibility complex class I-related gene protein-like n=1 Tax=Hemicordylus capensis TaxID=884348 RepID=UPI00230287AF|nr:major histocompatibility complex class I-related gene protein-like [Hemicordylus capensis]